MNKITSSPAKLCGGRTGEGSKMADFTERSKNFPLNTLPSIPSYKRERKLDVISPTLWEVTLWVDLPGSGSGNMKFFY